MTRSDDLPFSAFISYSHAADRRLAPALQHRLERLLAKWFQLRSFRIFRNRMNLALHPDAWEAIRSHLAQSR